MNAIEKLIDGYNIFRTQYLGQKFNDYRKEASIQQKPRIMVIGCCDSRVNPNIITNSHLGEIFTVDNVANLVPPYNSEGKNTHHGTSAAIEFAIETLGVEHIIVLGHSTCGGIRALVEGTTSNNKGIFSFIQPWMEIAIKARDYVKENFANCSVEEQAAICEKQAILISLSNLGTFPWVKQELDNNKLQLHGWYFNISTGDLQAYNHNSGEFECLSYSTNSDNKIKCC